MTNDRCDWDWLAFQYIAGELTAEESAGFEDRLALSQEAREAVARAVELAHVTAIALDTKTAQGTVIIQDRPVEPVCIKSPGVSAVVWTRRLAWMACGAAACLLLVVLVQQSRATRLTALNDAEMNEGLVSGPPTAIVESPELALAWAQARSNVSATDMAEASTVEIVGAAAVNGVDSEDDGITAPSWMLVAVAGLTGVEEIE